MLAAEAVPLPEHRPLSQDEAAQVPPAHLGTASEWFGCTGDDPSHRGTRRGDEQVEYRIPLGGPALRSWGCEPDGCIAGAGSYAMGLGAALTALYRELLGEDEKLEV